jgi:UDP-N-acetylglucosamine--N-acetylmuramyl-(pentapeptide) pyrophosphoryl-undecaprenol N-acetylglucosamine transferase
VSGTWAIVAGGGTGGHVTPALAVAQALVARGHPPDTIHFVGSRRGVEQRMVPAAGFSLTALPGRGIERRLSWRALAAAAALVAGVVAGFFVVARRRPAVVVSVGGFASVPCALAAVILRIPLVVVEQNSFPGVANRLAARFAAACAVAFPDTPLPRATVCGNPVRQEVLQIDRHRDRAAARHTLGLPNERVVVAVTGGSLGARRINEAVSEAVAGPLGRDERLAIHHVVGTRDWPELSTRLPHPPGDGCWYRAVDYEDRMDALLAAADLFVCRAGASTIFELAAAGLPAVLVPFPGATGDHQTANARTVVAAGGGVLVPDHELTSERLVAELHALVHAPGRRDRLGRGMASLARPDAADCVAVLVEAHARG